VSARSLAPFGRRRLRVTGEPYGLRYAEVFDAWESRGGIVPSLLPAEPDDGEVQHPDREAGA